jgi:competence protein ComEC
VDSAQAQTWDQIRAERERRLWPDAPRVAPLRFRHIPILVAALCFAAGIATPKLTAPVYRPSALLLVATLCLVGLTILTMRLHLRVAVVSVCALCFTAGLWCAQIEPYPPQQTQLLSYADGLSRTMQAHVVRIRELPPLNPDATDDIDRDVDFEERDLAAARTTYSVDLALTAIEDVTPDLSTMVPITGGVRATLVTRDGIPVPNLHCGDVLEAPVRLHQPQRFRDPGVFQFADYMLTEDADGIAATTIIPAGKLHVIAGPPLSLRAAARCHIAAAQTWAASRLLHYVTATPNRRLHHSLSLSPDDAATLNAMLFGDRTRLTHQLRLGFERTGSFHLFVVSGMHVGLLAGLLLLLSERLHLRRWVASLLTLMLTTGYALLTGFGVPVQRALFMTAIFLCARLLFRERVALNALGAAALIVLVASPRALFETSFQMTFLALIAIVGIAAPLTEHRLAQWSYAAQALDQRWKDTSLPPRLAQLRVMLRLWGEVLGEVLGPIAVSIPAHSVRALLWVAEIAVVGLIAEAVMILPMALYFHRATVFALPANMLSIPLVAIVASLGLVTFLFSLASPWLAVAPAVLTAALLSLLRAAIEAISQSHIADVRVPGPALARSLAALVCVALCCWLARRDRLWAVGPAILLSCAALCVLWPHAPSVSPGTLEVTAIDVGQGDSLLIVGPTGRTMLVDAGGPTGAAARAENASGTPAFDVGGEVVSPYLWSRQIRSLDVLVLSHAHSDHMGGMPAVLRNFRPRELWVGVDPSSTAYRDLLAEAAAYGTTIRHLRAPDTLDWDAASLAVLSPSPTYTNTGLPTNNDSLVLRMQFGRSSVLLEGDAEAQSEHTMLAAAHTSTTGNPTGAADNGLLGPITLLKVAHHGSRTSTIQELLTALAPQDAIISAGKGNSFGHPRPEIIARLAQAHAHVYRTDEFGVTTFRLSPDGKISALNPASNP